MFFFLIYELPANMYNENSLVFKLPIVLYDVPWGAEETEETKQIIISALDYGRIF